MRRLDIQGLRAVAVTVVVLDHAGMGLFSGGYVGVDVFFVLSGFLITSLLIKEAVATGTISIGDFYARRARRILPAATVVLVAVLAVSAATLSFVRLARTAGDVGWSAAFLANVRFAQLGTDYFSEGRAVSPVQHYWSLAVEEQFYVVWPLLLIGLLALVRRQGGDVDSRRTWGRVARVVTALAVVSFLWSALLLRDDRTLAYFSSLGRAWELAAGALLAILAHRLGALTLRARGLLSIAGLTAIVWSVMVYDDATPFPGPAALLPVLGTVAVIAAGCGTDAVGPARVLTTKPFTVVGDLSYSWYLWHWPVLVLWGAQADGPVGWLETTVLVLVSLGLAYASFRWIEDPVRRSRWLAGNRVRALSLWPTAVGCVVMAVLGAQMIGESRLSGRLVTAQGVDLSQSGASASAQLRASLSAADERAPVAFALDGLDQLGDLENDLWHADYDCNAVRDESETELCPVGDTEAERTMVVIGDSHAGQWLTALDALARRTGFRVVPLIKYGCTPYDVDLTTRGRPYEECADFRTWAIAQVKELRADVVVLGSRAMQGNMTDADDGTQRDLSWRRGVRSTIQRLRPLVDQVVLIGDTPGLRVDPIECVTDPEATMATCTTRVRPRVLKANTILRAEARRARVDYVDVTDLSCPVRRCTAVAGGRMVYANQEHLSRTWVRHVAPELGARLGLA